MTDGSVLVLGIALVAALAVAADAVPAAGPVESALPPAPAGSHWEAIPKLSDEFNGTTLDPEKWQPIQPYWKGREPSHFDPANVDVKDGRLELHSTTKVDSLVGIADPQKDVWVQSACVSSKAPTASYGYYEARVKASKLSMTSSFWFQGKYSEIDVVEEIGDPTNEKSQPESQLMLMNTHYFQGGWKADKATPARWKMPSGAADDYHVYGVWWKDKDTLWFYHDGQKVAEMKPGGEFLEPMWMFFDTEVFTWYGLPTIESLKDPARNTMSVDWVRSWKLVPDR
jgi:beta-glucanase (GH16 family)